MSWSRGSEYSVAVAYLLWFLGGFGTLGLHRLYLGKVPTAIIWFFTGGLFFGGAVYDFLTLGRQVEALNRQRFLVSLYEGGDGALRDGGTTQGSLYRAIFQVARDNRGRVTPALVAERCDQPLERIEEKLKELAAKKFATMKITRYNRTMVYYFPEFDPGELSDLEDLI